LDFDALIARAFYSGGMQDRKHLENSLFACANSLFSRLNSVLNAFTGIPFNFARNPYLREAFIFAASHILTGYQMPGYNKFREGLLTEERAHIDKLLSSCHRPEGNAGTLAHFV
jgi:hypothetical protein